MLNWILTNEHNLKPHKCRNKATGKRGKLKVRKRNTQNRKPNYSYRNTKRANRLNHRNTDRGRKPKKKIYRTQRERTDSKHRNTDRELKTHRNLQSSKGENGFWNTETKTENWKPIETSRTQRERTDLKHRNIDRELKTHWNLQNTKGEKTDLELQKHRQRTENPLKSTEHKGKERIWNTETQTENWKPIEL